MVYNVGATGVAVIRGNGKWARVGVCRTWNLHTGIPAIKYLHVSLSSPKVDVIYIYVPADVVATELNCDQLPTLLPSRNPPEIISADIIKYHPDQFFRYRWMEKVNLL